MGGLFSSQSIERERIEKEEKQRQLNEYAAIERIERLRNLERLRHIDRVIDHTYSITTNRSDAIHQNIIAYQRQNNNVIAESIGSQLVKLNTGKHRHRLVEKILQNCRYTYFDKIVTEDCEINASDRNAVEFQFKTTTQKHFKVNKLERVQNPFVKACYFLRKKEYEIRYGRDNVREDFVFHGTGRHNIRPIRDNNFDWRRHGRAKGNIFGKGVSFTPISNYASNYSDKLAINKCMFGVHVLVSQVCEGNKNMVFPPVCHFNRKSRYDTSAKPNGQVIVKYRDDEFYPSFIITFMGTTIKKSV